MCFDGKGEFDVFRLLSGRIFQNFMVSYPPWKPIASSHLPLACLPQKRKLACLSTIHFQLLCRVSFTECIFLMPKTWKNQRKAFQWWDLGFGNTKDICAWVHFMLGVLIFREKSRWKHEHNKKTSLGFYQTEASKISVMAWFWDVSAWYRWYLVQSILSMLKLPVGVPLKVQGCDDTNKKTTICGRTCEWKHILCIYSYLYVKKMFFIHRVWPPFPYNSDHQDDMKHLGPIWSQ